MDQHHAKLAPGRLIIASHKTRAKVAGNPGRCSSLMARSRSAGDRGIAGPEDGNRDDFCPKMALAPRRRGEREGADCVALADDKRAVRGGAGRAAGVYTALDWARAAMVRGRAGPRLVYGDGQGRGTAWSEQGPGRKDPRRLFWSRRFRFGLGRMRQLRIVFEDEFRATF